MAILSVNWAFKNIDLISHSVYHKCVLALLVICVRWCFLWSFDPQTLKYFQGCFHEQSLVLLKNQDIELSLASNKWYCRLLAKLFNPLLRDLLDIMIDYWFVWHQVSSLDKRIVQYSQIMLCLSEKAWFHHSILVSWQIKP